MNKFCRNSNLINLDQRKTNLSMKKIVALLAIFLISMSVQGAEETLISNLPQDSSMVYDFPEKMAQFPGGADAMDMFIRKNINYPQRLKDAGVTGKVYIQFVVEKDGKITNVTVRRGANPELDKEALLLVKKMPDWVPGSVRGKKVRVKQTLPIVFS